MSVEVKLGQGLTLGAEPLLQLQLHSALDPMYGAVQAQTLQARVRGSFDLASQALQEQKVYVYRDGELLSTQRLKRCTRQSRDQTELLCRSDLEFLKGEFLGGMYTDVDALAIVDWVLGGHSFSMDDTITNRKVSGYLPISTRAGALRQVAFVLGAVVSLDKWGHLRLTAPVEQEQVIIPRERIYTGARMETLPAYTKVELVAHQYTPATEWVELYHRKEFGHDPVTLKFDNPNAEYRLFDGFEIESGPNFITFLPTDYTGLSVRPYIHTETYHTVEEPPAESGYSRVYSERKMTLVNPSNVQQVLQRVYERTKMCQKLTVDAVIQEERTGQQVLLDTPWGTRFSGFISQMDGVLTKEKHMARLMIQGQEQEGENG